MTNSIATSPEQFIFAQNSELKTNSLKIAEAFNKLHKDVIRKIENLDCSKDFYERNFTPIQVDTDLGQNRKRKDKAYEMTRDGFIFVIMGFTGKKAAAIKESYINAFNLMHKKLFPVQNALVELPQLITTAQQGELFTRVVNKSETSGKTRAYFWARFSNHFVINSYKNLPYEKFDEGMEYLRKLEGDCEGGFMALTPQELSKVIQENTPLSRQGKLSLNFEITDPDTRFLLSVENGKTTIAPIPYDKLIIDREEIKNNLHAILPGYRLLDKETNAIFTVFKNQIIEQHNLPEKMAR